MKRFDVFISFCVITFDALTFLIFLHRLMTCSCTAFVRPVQTTGTYWHTTAHESNGSMFPRQYVANLHSECDARWVEMTCLTFLTKATPSRFLCGNIQISYEHLPSPLVFLTIWISIFSTVLINSVCVT